MGWQNKNGALITSVMWGSALAGSLIGYSSVSAISPRNMIIMDLAIVAAGVTLSFFVRIHSYILWVSICLVAAGSTTLYAAGILWASSYVEITGAVSSVFACASAAGMLSGPALTGFLMDTISYMCFVYVMIGAIAAMIISYIGALLYARKYGLRMFVCARLIVKS